MQKVSQYKTASSYAQAWFQSALEKKSLDNISQEVRALSESITQDADLWTALAHDTDNTDLQTHIIKDIAQKIKLSDLSLKTLLLITENKRLKLLKLILEEFLRLYYKNEGIVEVKVETIMPLSAQQDKRLKQVLEKKLASSVVIEYSIKPEILGGLMISFNDFQIDDTLYGKLQQVKTLMLNQDIE